MRKYSRRRERTGRNDLARVPELAENNDGAWCRKGARNALRAPLYNQDEGTINSSLHAFACCAIQQGRTTEFFTHKTSQFVASARSRRRLWHVGRITTTPMRTSSSRAEVNNSDCQWGGDVTMQQRSNRYSRWLVSAMGGALVLGSAACDNKDFNVVGLLATFHHGEFGQQRPGRRRRPGARAANCSTRLGSKWFFARERGRDMDCVVGRWFRERSGDARRMSTATRR